MGGGIASAAETGIPANSTQQQSDGVCTGVVSDETGEPVIGASVVVKGTLNGVITDVDGHFSLGGVKEGDVIQIACLGFLTQEYTWTGQVLNAVLAQDAKLLEESVVVGFGTQKKVNLTGAVSVVDSEDLSSRPVSNVSQALQGAVPGMNFSYSGQGAKLGATMDVNIRGTGTLDANVANASPLILIDGVEGDMNMINPDEIESISVLKDASSSAVYGSRAPYGVILITTKKGKSGRVSVNYNNSFRWSQGIGMPKMANAYDYAMYINEIGLNTDGSTEFDAAHLQRIKDYMAGTLKETTFPDAATPTIFNWKGNANVDWLDEIFGGTGFSHEHTLSASGGTEKYQFYLSANFLDQNGIIRYGKENLKRYNVSAKINAELAKWLDVNYSVRFIRQDLTQPYKLDDDLFYYDVMRRWPTQPVLDNNGNYLTELTKYLMWGGDNNSQTDVLYNQLQLVIEPIKGWKTYVDLNYRTNNYFIDMERFKIPKYDVNGELYYESTEKSSITTQSERTNYFNTNIYSEYSHSWNDHNFKATLGFQSEYNIWKRTGAGRDNLITDEITDVVAATGDMYLYGGRNHWATAGFFGRVNYDYKGKYLFEVVLRYDGTSRFSPETRWSTYPSFSFGWNLAKEGFMEPVNRIINTLKPRFSWGQLGNQNTVSLYNYIQTMPFYSSTDTANNTWLINGSRVNGSTAPGLIASSLTWETMTSWNVGFDFGMFNNRFTGTFDYFVRKTTGMVGPAPELPVTLGTAVPKANNADMQSTGFELDLSWRDQVGDFSYGIRFNLSDDRQKILKYPNDAKSLSVWREGQYIGEIWGLTTIGIAQSQEEMDAHIASLPFGGQLGVSGWTEGDIMYADINNDGKVSWGNTMDDLGDIRIIGNSSPRFKFGFDFDFQWKGIDLRIFLQGVAKRDYVFASGNILYWGVGGGVWQAAMYENNYDFYRPDGDDWLGANKDAKFARPVGGGRNQYAQTRYLENAAYIRLKNLQIGYTLPSKWTDKIGISKLRIFFSGENLFTITGLPDGIDPETLGLNSTNSSGISSYPLTRTFSTGLSINF